MDDALLTILTGLTREQFDRCGATSDVFLQLLLAVAKLGLGSTRYLAASLRVPRAAILASPAARLMGVLLRAAPAKIVALIGAGMSAAAGLRCFRGAGADDTLGRFLLPGQTLAGIFGLPGFLACPADFFAFARRADL